MERQKSCVSGRRVRWLLRHGLGRRRPRRAARVQLARADLRTRRAGRGLLAHGTRDLRRRLSRRRPGAQQFQLSLHAGRLNDGTGALAIGCTVFAAGVGHTEMQVQAIAELRPAGYIGTPSFLKIIWRRRPNSVPR